MTIDRAMLCLLSDFGLLCGGLVLMAVEGQAISPADSLRLCDLRRLTSVFVVLVKLADFE